MSDMTTRLQSYNPGALPPGTRLGEFEVLHLLGVGGFGMVYLAFDHALEREVAVKEYMPASLAGRTETMHVSVRSRSDADTFALGLRSFVNEARLLARFDHPSLLKVHRFWEANGTAYMAMPVMRGHTLKNVRYEMQQPPDEAWLRALLTPLLGAIEKLHSEGVYHRDIAPDNIQIASDGHPVLLDFGAARRVIADKSQTLTAILKPAYAPIEQYAEVGAVKQGPWTDLYALGATLHFLLLNRPPPPATARAVHDDISALSTDACPGCSEIFLRTIDWMLAPRPDDRPQSVAALREVLDGHAPPPRRRIDAQPPPSQWDRTVVLDPAQSTTVVSPRTAPMPPPVPAPVWAPAPTLQGAAAMPADSRRKWLPLAAGVAVMALAAGAFALWPRGPAPNVVDAAASAAPAAVAAAASVALPSLNLTASQASGVLESALTAVVVPSRPSPPAVQPAAAARQLPPMTTVQPNAMPAALPAEQRAATPVPRTAKPQLTPPVERPNPTAAQGPEAKCGERNLLRYFVCMERECLRSRFASHPDCLKWRAEAPRENRN